MNVEKSDRFLAETHRVLNQPEALVDYNAYTRDPALREAVTRENAQWANGSLSDYGALVGSAELIEAGTLANAHPPQLFTHDRYGHRIDEVRYHPCYHRLMTLAIENGLHSSPWTEPGHGAHVARAARYYLHSQVEAAHGCPVTMTFAAIPALRHQPDLLDRYGARITARHYDPRNLPARAKRGMTIGMAMTEKQGGSDVRANTTRAFALGARGPGQAYELLGHKWFVSAPMCDAFLVLAQTEGGLSCFFLPRWRPDGDKNAMHIQQLKDKMGNVANASCETELRGALAWMVGADGRGVRTIIEMVAATRYDCMIGSAAGMRQALVQAVHHARHRSAFGRRLSEQALMKNVLADLALESEAAVHYMMRVARAMDQAADDEQARLLARIATPLGKYFICKRTPNHAYEAMEVIGGTGVMETHLMARLFRESPVNAIWEGSGNVQCLDLLRVLQKEPACLAAFAAELDDAQRADQRLDHHVKRLSRALRRTDRLEFGARRLVEDMALALQAALLINQAPGAVAEAFLSARMGDDRGLNYGCLPAGVEADALIDRCFPDDTA